MKIGVYAKPYRSDFAPRLKEIVEWLKARGCQVVVEREVAGAFQLEGVSAFEREEIPDCVDTILVFGGDGSILFLARLIEGRNAPILAVNLGSLGFLTEVTLEELYPALEQLLAGKHRLEKRRMLKAEVLRNGKEQVGVYHALNDVVINKGALARMICLDGYVNGGLIARYMADGMIIATPTGSTAYSLSAGGPIVYPTLEALLITPICPHTLTNRPLVISSESRIDFVLRSGEDVSVSVDGQIGIRLPEGDSVRCTRSEYCIELVQPHDKTYFDVLREKLKWGER